MSKGKRVPIDPNTNGGRLYAARTQAGLSLIDMGFNIGYLSRIEHNFLPVTPGVLAAYVRLTGKHIELISSQKPGVVEQQQGAVQPQKLYRIVLRQVLTCVAYTYAVDEEEANRKKDYLNDYTSIMDFECVDAENWVEEVVDTRGVSAWEITEIPFPLAHTRSTPGA